MMKALPRPKRGWALLWTPDGERFGLLHKGGIHPPIEVVFAFVAPDREAMLEALTRAWFTRGEVERLEAQGWRVDVVGGANIPRDWRYVFGTMFTRVA